MVDSGSYTPQDVARRRQLAQALMSEMPRAREPFGMLANALRGAQSGYEDRQASDAEAANLQRMAQMLSNPEGQSNNQLMGAMGDPWASPQQASMIQALLGERRDDQNRSQAWAREDARYAQGQPMRDLEMQIKQAQMQAMQNPQAEIPDSVQALDLRAQRAGLQQGTPEYNEFMLSGGRGGTALTVGPDGSVQFQQGNVKPLTEAQSKDTVYATRAAGALPVVDKLEQSLLSFGETVAGNMPLGLGNYLQSEDYQVANNAGKEFLASILRKDTGAAVTPSEEKMYGEIFLPRPGDKPAVIARKRQARALAVEAIKAGMPPQAILNMNSALDAVGAGQGVQAGGPAQPADPQLTSPVQPGWTDLGNGIRIRVK